MCRRPIDPIERRASPARRPYEDLSPVELAALRPNLRALVDLLSEISGIPRRRILNHGMHNMTIEDYTRGESPENVDRVIALVRGFSPLLAGYSRERMLHVNMSQAIVMDRYAGVM